MRKQDVSPAKQSACFARTHDLYDNLRFFAAGTPSEVTSGSLTFLQIQSRMPPISITKVLTSRHGIKYAMSACPSTAQQAWNVSHRICS